MEHSEYVCKTRESGISVIKIDVIMKERIEQCTGYTNQKAVWREKYTLFEINYSTRSM